MSIYIPKNVKYVKTVNLLKYGRHFQRDKYCISSYHMSSLIPIFDMMKNTKTTHVRVQLKYTSENFVQGIPDT